MSDEMVECPTCGAPALLEADDEVRGRFFFTCQNDDCGDNGIFRE